jgi:hypothetical protein
MDGSTISMPHLCQVCLNVLQFRQGVRRETSESLFLAHHANVQSFMFSANTNCFICCTLWNGLPPSEKMRAMQPVTRPFLTAVLMMKRVGTEAVNKRIGGRSFSISCAMPRGPSAEMGTDGTARPASQRFYLQPVEGEWCAVSIGERADRDYRRGTVSFERTRGSVNGLDSVLGSCNQLAQLLPSESHEMQKRK